MYAWKLIFLAVLNRYIKIFYNDVYNLKHSIINIKINLTEAFM
jgi:hypothetical protein